MQRFSLPALEYHVAHGCNLSCQQLQPLQQFSLGRQVVNARQR